MMAPARILSRIAARAQRKVRYKILALVLLPLVLVIPMVIGLVALWGEDFSYAQLFRKANTDLRVAHDAFERMQREYLTELSSLAHSYPFQKHLEQGHWGALKTMIENLEGQEGFVFLHLVGPQGQWLAEPGKSGLRRSKPTPLVSEGFNGEPASGVEVFSNTELARENPSRAKKIIQPLVETPHSDSTGRKYEDRGLVVRLVQPVFDAKGEVVAVLDGGLLLNKNFSFVDTIRDLVYGPGSLPEASHGAVTVFLGDVRVSTNVPMDPGERALGTRASEEVREQVLEEGERWVDRAFVVNDWYISAYRPIIDVNGDRVGMLYAGFLEQPFRDSVHTALGVILLLMLLVLGFAVVVAARGARVIFQPLEAMAGVARATMAGEDRRIGPVRARDEIGELATRFDRMLDLLQERNHELERAAEELEAKVAERTEMAERRNRELSETVDALRETREQLVQAEKLAAVGQLTAGIAHEINNPTAIILGHVDLLIDKLDEEDAEAREEANTILQQVERIRSIIDNLLQYTRPRGSAVGLSFIEVNDVIEESLELFRHDIKERGVQLERELAATQTVRVKAQELQQVLVNMLMNALQAVSDEGTIWVRSRDQGHEGVVIEVADNGRGMDADAIARVFDPFYTTRREGTGLGMSVSYGIVRGYGGDITVQSEEGVGTLFQIWLPRSGKGCEKSVSQSDRVSASEGLEVDDERGTLQ